MSSSSASKRRPSPDARGVVSLLARAVAAVVGGYLLSVGATIALTVLLSWLGVSMVEAVLGGTMASFLLYAVIVMAVFHARTARRAWLGLLVAATPCGVVIALGMITGNI